MRKEHAYMCSEGLGDPSGRPLSPGWSRRRLSRLGLCREGWLSRLRRRPVPDRHPDDVDDSAIVTREHGRGARLLEDKEKLVAEVHVKPGGVVVAAPDGEIESVRVRNVWRQRAGR